MHYYTVAPTKIFRAGSDILTYESSESLPLGALVLVPLGKTTTPGLILEEVNQPDFPTKPILRKLYDQPLPPHLTKAILWLSEYYFCPLPTVLQTAFPRGIEKTRRREKNSTHNFHKPNSLSKLQSGPPLTPAQLTALSKISSCPSTTILLHGITGSGKTNLYLKLAHEQLSLKKSVIILTPEIALTSQLVKIFQTHFKNITLLHSEQTESQRHILWEKLLKSDQPEIIIGPRSALFAPVKDLGLIIIDEAHEPAYSQDQSPKYSALRLASTISKIINQGSTLHGVSQSEPLLAGLNPDNASSKTLLGTATPLITDYYLAAKNHALVPLSELAIKSDYAATIKIIDLKDRDSFKRHRILSDPLLASIENSCENHTMSMLFHNRRGSAPLTLCEACGWQALCPACLLPLTLHSDQFTLLCHTCGRRAKIPTSCPECRHANILHKGFGTKYLESELTKLFPGKKIARFDADTPDIAAMKNVYQEVKNGHFDIIIGTQMIAKGFDFPNLSTLGVVQADSQLSLPDFSSEERTFHLISQVIGRAHRGHQNTEIFVQTYQPDHPAVKYATAGDYPSFYRHLLKSRQAASLPPYCYLLKLSLTYKTEATTLKNIKKLRELIIARLKPADFCFSVSAPLPAFHEHTPSGYTWNLIIKSKSRAPLLSLLKSLPKNPALHFSLDPPTLL